MGYLETVEVDDDALQRAPFRMPVQWVNRPHPDFRGFAGIVASGTCGRATASACSLPGAESTRGADRRV